MAKQQAGTQVLLLISCPTSLSPDWSASLASSSLRDSGLPGDTYSSPCNLGLPEMSTPLLLTWCSQPLAPSIRSPIQHSSEVTGEPTKASVGEWL